MAPAIKRSIGQGFRTANRSWLGIGFLIGCWIVAWLIAVGLVVLTRIPRELLNPPQPAAQTETGLADDAASPAGGETQAEQEAADQWVQTALEWLGRAWPVLLLALLLMMALGLWLQGGQIGYVAQHVRSGTSSLADFIGAGTKAFVPLLGAWGVSLAAGIALTIVAALGIWVMSLLAEAAGWLATILGILMGVAAVAGLIWLGVKLVFWYIAVVVDGNGPIEGLKTSFRLTRGYWLKLLGLGALLGLISLGLQLGVGLIEGLGNLIGGLFATALSVLGNVLGALVNLFLGFVGIAAFVRFYEDIKAGASASPPGAAPSPGA